MSEISPYNPITPLDSQSDPADEAGVDIIASRGAYKLLDCRRLIGYENFRVLWDTLSHMETEL